MVGEAAVFGVDTLELGNDLPFSSGTGDQTSTIAERSAWKSDECGFPSQGSALEVIVMARALLLPSFAKKFCRWAVKLSATDSAVCDGTMRMDSVARALREMVTAVLASGTEI